MKKYCFFWLALLLYSLTINAQDAARDWTVQLTAEVSEDPVSITLNWVMNENETPTTYDIYRKVKGTNGWGPSIVSLPAETLTYTDESIEEGVSYEYFIQLRLGGTIYGWSYINSGVNVTLPANRGDLLLVVDQSFEASLATEINTLVQDLYADGWMVTTTYVDPASAVIDVKNQITDFNETLPNLTALYLLGNIPVPYAGELYPDAHEDHIGAWPADVFYADLDGAWTDVSVNNTTAASSRNHNVPGDGKFDQSTIPSNLELQVCRVDFSNLPAFEDSEENLLKNYLSKAHDFKIASYQPTERALVDQGDFAGFPEGFAQNGFRNFTNFFGSENINHIDYWSNLNGNDYLWSFGCGAGSYTSAGGLDDGSSLTSVEVASGFNESTFTMLFGSYFGDWDTSDNLMRAIIANGKTLSCSWAGRPNWHYHTMALGDNIGKSAFMSQDLSTDYLSLTLGGGDFITTEGVHVTQLGDPSLRLYYIIPPTDVEVVNSVSNAELSWTESLDPEIDGYNIYRRPANGLWEKINDAIVTASSFTDEDLPGAGNYYYLVKAVKHKTNSSGSFYNESLGAEGSTSFFASVNEQTHFECQVFPNPTTGQFTVQSAALITSIEIYAPDGKRIYTHEPNAFIHKIIMEDVEQGVYFIRVKANGIWVNEKVIID